MRIISGKYKGRRIKAPKNLPVRPTTDISKEAIFNIFHNEYDFDDIKVLDLFSGTGNISYEFLSRGCEQLTSVDANFRCVKFIQNTVTELLKSESEISVIKSDVLEFLNKAPYKYDIIFADPPYDIDLYYFEKSINTIFKRELLNKNGVLVFEHSKYTNLSHIENFNDKRTYGSSAFSFFEK